MYVPIRDSFVFFHICKLNYEAQHAQALSGFVMLLGGCQSYEQEWHTSRHEYRFSFCDRYNLVLCQSKPCSFSSKDKHFYISIYIYYRSRHELRRIHDAKSVIISYSFREEQNEYCFPSMVLQHHVWAKNVVRDLLIESRRWISQMLWHVSHVTSMLEMKCDNEVSSIHGIVDARENNLPELLGNSLFPRQHMSEFTAVQNYLMR